MGRCTWIVAALIISVAGARADSPTGFVVSYTSAQGTGDLVGLTLYQFYARNAGDGLTAGTHGLLGIDALMTGLDQAGEPSPLLVYRSADNGDGTLTADFDGTQQYGLSHPHASYIRPTPIFRDFWDVFSTVPQANGDAVSRPDLGSIDSFEVATGGSDRSRSLPADATVNGGRGVFFAQAAVPAGDGARLEGTLLAEAGVPVRFSVTVPEPIAIALITVAVGALVRNRAPVVSTS